jgi:hypothetical protein
MATTAQRQHVKTLCDVFKAHAAHLLYPPGDVRTAEEWHDWHLSETQLEAVLTHGGSVMLDCSDTASFWFKCAGLWPFASPGYTGTWFDWLGRHAYTDAREALLAAPVIFGPRPGHHMGVVYRPDPVHGNPLIAGHGRPGFDIAPLSQVAAGQPPGITFLSIAAL